MDNFFRPLSPVPTPTENLAPLEDKIKINLGNNFEDNVENNPDGEVVQSGHKEVFGMDPSK